MHSTSKIKSSKFDINSLDGHQFEALIEELVKKMGFTVEERKLTVDGGIDILAHSFEPLYEGKYIIQCKRYSQKVSESPVRDLYGVVHSRNANKGILITNSTFTKAAIDFASDKQLELLDGSKLLRLLAKYKVVKNKGGVVLCDSAAYLIYNFHPSMKEIKESFDELRTGKIFTEKKVLNSITSIASNKLCQLVNRTTANSIEFYKWWINVCLEEFVPALREEPMNSQKVEEINQQMIRGLQNFLETYKIWLKADYPNWQKDEFAWFLTVKERCLTFLDALFDIFFLSVKELDFYATLSSDELRKNISSTGDIIVHFSAPFPNQLNHEISEAWGGRY